jgi:hypothetical protein
MPTIKATQSVDLDNPVQNDLHLLNGTIALIDGPEEVAQAIRSRLLFFKGEWFLDQREGTPYYQEILGKKAVDLNVIRTIYRDIISDTPGVDSVLNIDIILDGVTRAATLTFIALLENGGQINSRDFSPFIVELP